MSSAEPSAAGRRPAQRRAFSVSGDSFFAASFLAIVLDLLSVTIGFRIQELQSPSAHGASCRCYHAARWAAAMAFSADILPLVFCEKTSAELVIS